jgi:inosine/xanthosine triphosphatase
MNEIKICVGTLNPTKIYAVERAFSKYFNHFQIFKIKIKSSVPNQPIGMVEIIKGAKYRAQMSLNYLKNDKKLNVDIFGVGIEAGLVEITFAKTNYMDFQFCVIMDEYEKITIGSGVAFEYPQSVIDKIMSNRNSEIGDIMGKLANNPNLKNEAGAISFLSKNVINRTDILSQAVICALLPRINTKLYGD